MMAGSDPIEDSGHTMQLAQALQVLDAGLVVLIDRYLANQQCRQ